MPINLSHETINGKTWEIALYTGPDIADGKTSPKERARIIGDLEKEVTELSLAGLDFLRKQAEARLALQRYYAAQVKGPRFTSGLIKSIIGLINFFRQVLARRRYVKGYKSLLPICGLPLSIGEFVELLRRANLAYVRGYSDFCLDFREYASHIFSEGFPAGIDINVITGEEEFAESSVEHEPEENAGGEKNQENKDGTKSENAEEDAGDGAVNKEGQVSTEAENGEEDNNNSVGSDDKEFQDGGATEDSDDEEEDVCEVGGGIIDEIKRDFFHYFIFPWNIYSESMPRLARQRLKALVNNEFVERIYLMHADKETPQESFLVVYAADKRWRLVAHWGAEPLAPIEGIVAEK